jgi:hypothetical protein
MRSMLQVAGQEKLFATPPFAEKKLREIGGYLCVVVRVVLSYTTG